MLEREQQQLNLETNTTRFGNYKKLQSLIGISFNIVMMMQQIPKRQLVAISCNKISHCWKIQYMPKSTTLNFGIFLASYLSRLKIESIYRMKIRLTISKNFTNDAWLRKSSTLHSFFKFVSFSDDVTSLLYLFLGRSSQNIASNYINIKWKWWLKCWQGPTNLTNTKSCKSVRIITSCRGWGCCTVSAERSICFLGF